MREDQVAGYFPNASQSLKERLSVRKSIYISALKSKSVKKAILIVGDKPGPSAPQDPTFVHVPFYSMRHCSGWLNRTLEEEAIDEKRLIWVNSADKDGIPTDASILSKMNLVGIIALGGNAAKWLKLSGVDDFKKEYHPQYWKRFHNKERYPLFDSLKALTLL